MSSDIPVEKHTAQTTKFLIQPPFGLDCAVTKGTAWALFHTEKTARNPMLKKKNVCTQASKIKPCDLTQTFSSMFHL